MSAPADSRIRRNQSAEPHEAAKLTGETCAELDRLGVHVSPSKVSRLVHRWVGSRLRTDFGTFLASALVLDAETRARVAWGLRNAFGVTDPTGQRASARADRSLGLRGGIDD